MLITEAILLPGFNDFLTQRLLAQKGSVWVKPGSDRFRPIVHPLNLDPDLRFGSGNFLNLGPNLGPVQAGSGLNRGSEPDHGITKAHEKPKTERFEIILSTPEMQEAAWKFG